jgi:hypothetical protein
MYVLLNNDHETIYVLQIMINKFKLGTEYKTRHITQPYDVVSLMTLTTVSSRRSISLSTILDHYECIVFFSTVAKETHATH